MKSGASMTARTTDPATSHLAATYIARKRPGLKDAFLMALKALGPSTANEIAQWCVQSGVSANAESVRKRAKELIDSGLAKYGPQKECSVTKQQAGTLELVNGNPPDTNDESKHANANRRESTTDSGCDRTLPRDSQKVQSQPNANLANQTGSKAVQSPEADRIAAVAEFMRNERSDKMHIIDLANEMSSLAKMGTWPAGDSNQYIVAIESAALAGLIERSGSNVRRVKVVAEVKVVQKGLFE